MTAAVFRSQTRAMGLFWGLMGLCSILIVANVCLAINELGKPWSGFSFEQFGDVMKANETGLVFFDEIVAVGDRQLQSVKSRGAELREILRSTPEGTPLTYHAQRGQTRLSVTVPVQRTTWRRLVVEAAFPLAVALGQLGLGALVFLLRPNSKRSWIFLGFCLAWFGLFATFYDFQSTHVFTHFFLFFWYMTSACLLHLAFVFPEERSIIRQHPRVQYLFYLPSLGLWGFNRLTSEFFHDFYLLYDIGQKVTYTHTVYWAATLLCLLGSLTHTALRATSPVARRRAVTVCFGFAVSFLIPVGGESAALLLHVNLPLEFAWLLTLFLPLSITYAILRYNLFDVGIIVRRTLTYGLLTATVVGAYLLCALLSNKLLHGTPIAQSRSFPVLFALVVLFVLNPLRGRLQHVLDRVFFRTRYDFRQTIERLSQDLTSLLDLDEITARIVHTVMQALDITSVALFLEDENGTYRAQTVAGEETERLVRVQPRRDNPVIELIAQRLQGVSRYDFEADPMLAEKAPQAAEAFEHLGVSLALPIVFKEELIGLLALGEKKSGAIFTADDIELLRTLLNQSAIAIANARSYRSLEETNAALRSALRKVEMLEHVKTHLGKFVPASVRRLIELDPAAPALDKHEQDVSVLFLDIAGYASMSQALDQEKVNYLIERYFSSFLDDIYANQGDINETAGDGLMIIFQDDDPRAHAHAAVHTALAIRDKTRRINAELQGMYEPITVNMGINSGLAAVGSTKFEGATGTRWTFTASGPVTNLAARIGAFATHGSIYIGAATAARLSEEFELQELGAQRFKNVSQPVDVYEVLGQRVPADARETHNGPAFDLRAATERARHALT
jgi:class 3 adenylate cyclase